MIAAQSTQSMTATQNSNPARPRAALVPISSNRKTGPIAVSTSTSDTCPDSCPLKTSGCYAKQGNTRLHWQALDNGKRGHSWGDFLARIRTLPRGSKFRHNEAGDLPHDGQGQIAADSLQELTDACRSRNLTAFTYTHHPDTQHNIAALKNAALAGFIVNLSANNPEHADHLSQYGLPVCTVLPIDAENVSTTPAGRKVIACPAEKSERVTCSTCNLCQLPERPFIVGFRAHGTAKRKADSIARLPFFKESAA